MKPRYKPHLMPGQNGTKLIKNNCTSSVCPIEMA